MNRKLLACVAFGLLAVAGLTPPALASVVLSDHALFVLDRDTSTISEVDAVSGSILNSFATPVPVFKGGLATDGNSLFFATPPGQIYVLDPGTGTVQSSFASPVEAAPFGVSALGFGTTSFGPTLFGLANASDLILLLDPVTGNLLDVISAPIDPLTSQPINFADGLEYNPRTGTLFVGDFVNGFLYEIDPNSGALLNTFPPPGLLISGIGFIGDRMFAVDRDTNTIFELDPATGAILDDFAAGVASPYGLTGFDAAPPTLSLPENVTEECTSPIGQSVDIGMATAFDPFDSMPVITNDAPSTFFLGTTIVTWTATDISGNFVSGTQQVEVVDTTPPALSLPADVTAECLVQGGQSIDIGSATAPDICDPEPSITNDAPSLFSLGTTVVTWTATDDEGNTATATQSVTVVDTTAPSITAPPAVTAECLVQGGQSIDIGSATAPDICDPEPSITNDAPSLFSLGTTVVTWTATDDEGNTATATQSVTVVDTAAPSITAPPAITAECSNPAGQVVALGAPTVSDLCDPAPTVTNNAPALFSLGTTVVTWTATDAQGNPATATQSVTVVDTTAPSITAPPAVTAECSNPAGQVVALGAPTVSDLCDPAPTVTNDAPSLFSLGTTVVTWTATDAQGNPATATQSVTVADTTAPSITAPPAVTAECSNPAGQVVALGAPTVSDLCDPAPTVTNNAPALFSLGLTIVTWTATDAQGNPASATQSVTVVDTAAPSITAPPAVTAECSNPAGQVVALGAPTVSDLCDPAPTVTNNAPALFSLGTTIVTWTATDAQGNPASATQSVTVVDTAAPSITAPPAVTAECSNPAGQIVPLGAPTVSDLCDPAPTVTNDAPSLFSLGTTIVTWTATDAQGNPATATQSVTVVDTAAPSITAPPAVTAECSNPAGQIVPLGAPTVSDLCDPAPTITNNAPLLFSLGTTVVTWTATDAQGNPATATQSVTVVDTMPPTIVLNGANPQIVECPGPYIELNALVTDLCDDEPNLTIDITGLNLNLPGDYTVTYDATDAEGNAAETVTRTVTVRDSENPQITCPDPITANNDPAICGAIVAYTVEFSDNCPGATLSQTAGLPSGSEFPVGVTTNTFVVTDIAGNTATCTFDVTVVDAEAPVIACPADIDAECESPAGAVVTFNVTASDNCDLCPPLFPETAGEEGPEGAPSAFVDFTQSTYFTDVNDLLTLDVAINYGAGNAGTDDLFSYGVRLVPDAGTPIDPDPGDILIAPVPELNFDAFNGPPASVDNDPSVLGVKGTVDVLSGPTVPYTGSTIASFGLRFLSEGVFNIGLDFFNTLGPTEMIFVTGDGVTLDPGIVFGTASVTVGEGCDTGVEIVCVPPSGSTFPIGTTIVDCIATDAAGNFDTCSFTVTVADTTPPVLSLPGNVTVECTNPAGQGVTIGAATATDICDPAPTITSDAPALFMPGATTVTWTATDAEGNASNGTQTVTVADTIPPALVDLQIDPDTADVTAGPQTVTFDVTTLDCTLETGILRIFDPEGESFAEETFLGTAPLPGGGEEAPEGATGPPGQQSFNVPVNFPQGSAPGTYTVEVFLEDSSGLIEIYGATGIAFPGGAESSVEVVFGSMIEVTVMENPMTGSPGPLEGAMVTLEPATPPSPPAEDGPEGVLVPPAVATTDENGIAVFENVPPGQYLVQMDFLKPGFCDQGVLDTPAEVFEVGGQLVQIGIDTPGATDCDTEAPQCAALSLLPDPIEASQMNPVPVTVTLGVSDDFAGFDHGTMKIFDANYNHVTTVTFADGTQTAGDELAGTFVLNFNLPPNADPGLYSVELELEDDFGNRAFHHPLDLLVPAYVSPAVDPFLWNDLVNLARDSSRKFNLNVVFNPASGPGESIDFNYIISGETDGPLILLDQTDACILGYVATGFGAKPIGDVQREIDKYLAPSGVIITGPGTSETEGPEGEFVPDIRWSNFVSIDGIFLDETSNDLNNVAFYQAIRAYIETNYPEAKIFSNPGTTFVNNLGGGFTPTDYANTADVLATFENTADAYLNNYTPPLWLEDFCAGDFLHLVHSFDPGESIPPDSEEGPEGTPPPLFDPSFLDLAESRRAGIVYFTDDGLFDSNPYDRLPFFWNQMITALNDHNCPAGKMMKFRVEEARPDNDDLANGRPLTGEFGNDTGSNVNASGEPGEAPPSCGSGGGIDSVWWSWTAPSDGTLTADTFGSDFDTVLAIWAGAGHPLAPLGCDDDFGASATPPASEGEGDEAPEGPGGSGFESLVSIPVTTGTTYYIAVYGFNDSGDIALSFNFTAVTGTPPEVEFSAWADAYGLEGAEADPDADADRDGDSNLYEAFAGSDPTDPASSNAPVFTLENGYLTLSVTRGPNAILGLSCDGQAAEHAMPWSGSADGETVILEESPALFKARDARPIGDCPGRVFRLKLSLE